MPHSITMNIQGELVQITFNSFRTGVQVAKTLQQHLNATNSVQQLEDIQNQLSNYARQISAFSLSQPLFVDSASNSTDFRAVTPSTSLCRTLLTTEIIPIQDVLNLQKQSLQPQPIKLPSMLPPMLPPTFQSKPPSVIQPQQITQQIPSNPVVIHQQHQNSNNNQIQQAPSMPHQNMPPQIQPIVSVEDQLFKPIQTLILLCAKNHQFISLMVEYTGVAVVSNDKDSIQRLCKIAAERILSLQIDQQIRMIRGIPFEGELKEKVIEILHKVQKPNIKPPVTVPVMQVPAIKKEPTKVIQNEEKVQQVMSVLKQLAPDAVSKLLNGPAPTQLTTAGSVGYKMSFKFNDFNTFKFKEKERSAIQETQLSGILVRVLQVWNTNILEIKNKNFQTSNENQVFREKIIKLFAKSQEMHQKCVNGQEMIKFHSNFTLEENITLLLKVKSQLKYSVKIYDFSNMQAQVQSQLSVRIFEKLKSIVEQHKGGGSMKPIQQTQPPPQMLPQAPITPMPQAPPAQNISSLQFASPQHQAPAMIPHQPPSQPPPVTSPHPPVIQHNVQQPSQKMTEQHKQILEDVQKTQNSLEMPSKHQIQHIQTLAKPAAIVKIFVTILGLGYQYHNLYLLEQNLLDKQLQTLKNDLNIETGVNDLKHIIDVLLRVFISFLNSKKNVSRYTFNAKQKPQMVIIQPQTNAKYQLADWCQNYQQVCEIIRIERKSKGSDADYYHMSSQFQLFEKKELMEMFQGVNVFGDYIDLINIGE